MAALHPCAGRTSPGAGTSERDSCRRQEYSRNRRESRKEKTQMKPPTHVRVATFFSVLVLISVLVFAAFVLARDRNLVSQERSTHEGVVVALEHSPGWTKVWLNSRPRALSVRGTARLQIGERYTITVDGDDRIVDIVYTGTRSR